MDEKESKISENFPGSQSQEPDGSEVSRGCEEEIRGRKDCLDSIIDVSGKSLDFPLLDSAERYAEGLYMYKNVFNLIPKTIGTLGKLKTLKFFANEVNLLPPEEFRSLLQLECLQVKVGSPGLTGLELQKLNGLKELELSKVPEKPSAFPILREISELKCLTKLSVCHFSIRYLPPEIGCLNNLEYLDLSFNKIRNLPIEVTRLNLLLSLKVANNKLEGVPSGFCLLKRLKSLDLSNNRLTSLECLELGSMHNLQILNIRNNKLFTICQIPAWICCDFEGNGIGIIKEDLLCHPSEMDVFEVVEEISGGSRNGSSITSPSHFTGPVPSNKCFAPRRSKGWKRRYQLQMRARQERLNSSRKWRSETNSATQSSSKKCMTCKHSLLDDAEVSSVDGSHGIDLKELLAGGAQCAKSYSENGGDDITSGKEPVLAECSCPAINSVNDRVENSNDKHDPSSDASTNITSVDDDSSHSEASSCSVKPKRHLDGVLDNPKPTKTRRPTDEYGELSSQYSRISFCGIYDHLPDGFYDAGRDRPFLPLRNYEQNLDLNSREVILLDRETDEMLDAILLRAQAMILYFKQIHHPSKERVQSSIGTLQLASLVALFVSDHFGGSDKSSVINQARKAVSGSNYDKPFVCTCPTGNLDSIELATKSSGVTVEDVAFQNLCDTSLQSVKKRINSVVIPLGSMQLGVCRHRALLMKYLCDRLEPQIPCELVRGYLDFMPHAWNVIVVKRGNSYSRMVVDACRPVDIREETDPEYFCRYVPLCRISAPFVTQSDGGLCRQFPSVSVGEENTKSTSTTLIRCKLGSIEAAVKVRTLEISDASADEIRKFEHSCLGEVRILGVLKHPCIVDYYGHQILCKWGPVLDGNSQQSRLLQSAILMEYIEGGSLKGYLDKLIRAGEKGVPLELAILIAKDVSCALAELHARHIIHRDIKSENVLIDLDKKRTDGTPIVKLCDFDRAVPLRACLHSCCIAHTGTPPPYVCVGTPRWMAPEVFQTMHKHNVYGLESDIWSFGCLLLELLTLEVPFQGLADADIHDCLQMGKRPELTKELETVAQSSSKDLDDFGSKGSNTEVEGPGEARILKFFVTMFRRCTEKNPKDRPTAAEISSLLLDYASSVTDPRNIDQN